MNWDVIIALVGALGGLELLKFLFTRKSSVRTATAEANGVEFHVMQEVNTFLQEQLKTKEERFAEQTQLVRQQNRDLIALERKVAELEIELVQKRCNDDDCPFRQPPNAKTPPKPGLTKEQYFSKSRNDEQDNDTH